MNLIFIIYNHQKNADMEKILILKMYPIYKIIIMSTINENINILYFMKYNFKNHTNLIKHKLEENS